LFQTGDVVYGEGKLRDLGMVFKPKCLKNEKINFSPAFLKLETLLYQSIHISFILYYIRRAILIKKKENWSNRKITCQIDLCHTSNISSKGWFIHLFEKK